MKINVLLDGQMIKDVSITALVYWIRLAKKKGLKEIEIIINTKS